MQYSVFIVTPLCLLERQRKLCVKEYSCKRTRDDDMKVIGGGDGCEVLVTCEMGNDESPLTNVNPIKI